MTFGSTGNNGNPLPPFLRVIKYIRTHYPFWDARNGSDHVFWAAGDQGLCPVPKIMSRSILVQHFGSVKGIGNDNRGAECYWDERTAIAPPVTPDDWTSQARDAAQSAQLRHKYQGVAAGAVPA